MLAVQYDIKKKRDILAPLYNSKMRPPQNLALIRYIKNNIPFFHEGY